MRDIVTTAVEIGCDYLAGDGWKRERQDRNVGHGGRGLERYARGVGLDTQYLRRIRTLGHARESLKARLS